VGIQATVGGRGTARPDRLFESFVPSLTRLAYLLTGDPDASGRIAAAAFARGFACFQDLKDPDSFGLTLRRNTLMLCARWARRRRLLALIPGHRLPVPPVSRETLRGSLAELPSRKRAALVLTLHEGLTSQQAADVLGCSVGTLNSLQRDALAQLSIGRPDDSATDMAAVLQGHPAAGAGSLALPPLHRVIARAHLLRAALVITVFTSGALGAVLVTSGVLSHLATTTRDEALVPDRSFAPNFENTLDGNLTPAGPRVTLGSGLSDDRRWFVEAYRNVDRELCMAVRLGSYESAHCISPARSGLHYFVSSDLVHDTSFVFGDAGHDVATIDVRLQDYGALRVNSYEVSSRARVRRAGRVFLAVVPRYALRLSSPDEATELGYKALDGVLIARDASGRVVQRSFLYLGRPRV
jgi:DNA-directed RNA polymerase specialized sigma24 family protein